MVHVACFTRVTIPAASEGPFQEWLCWLDWGLPVDAEGSAGVMAKDVVEPDAADELVKKLKGSGLMRDQSVHSVADVLSWTLCRAGAKARQTSISLCQSTLSSKKGTKDWCKGWSWPFFHVMPYINSFPSKKSLGLDLLSVYIVR